MGVWFGIVVCAMTLVIIILIVKNKYLFSYLIIFS